MAIRASDFLKEYPKYSSVPTDQVEAALRRSERKCPIKVWDEDQAEGIMLYMAHLLESEWQQSIATAGAATAIAQGQAGDSSLTGDDLDRTIYGQQFRRLRSSLPITGFVI